MIIIIHTYIHLVFDYGHGSAIHRERDGRDGKENKHLQSQRECDVYDIEKMSLINKGQRTARGRKRGNCHGDELRDKR